MIYYPKKLSSLLKDLELKKIANFRNWNIFLRIKLVKDN